MPGLDKKVLDAIQPKEVLQRIKIDTRTDFILAPHYNAVFVNAGLQLWERVREQLRAGTYEPSMPHTISVPKERGFTRPGSILSPMDRFVYQALIDVASPALESQLDRTRTYSHVLSSTPEAMFEDAHVSWTQFQSAVGAMCQQEGFVVKADIANYFERLPQHHLVNLMSAAQCSSEVVNLIEELLLAFQQRNSFGIVQGVFASDVLGNFFLSEFDGYCEVRGIPSARYVDDLYMYFGSEVAARRGLMSLIEQLRKDGLHLNEFKSGIRTSHDVLREETEIDALFEAARVEVRTEIEEVLSTGYGFTAEWEMEDDDTEERVKVAATERLYDAIEEHPEQSDKIERFCLPILRAGGSERAIAGVLTRLPDKPYLASYYHAYLARFAKSDQALVRSLEVVMQTSQLVSDYERMYLLGSMFGAKKVRRESCNEAVRWIGNMRMAPETRAMAALFVAKHGGPTQKRAVRNAYEDEPSTYVKGALLYASRYFTGPERKTCKKAWGAHSLENTLIAQTI